MPDAKAPSWEYGALLARITAAKWFTNGISLSYDEILSFAYQGAWKAHCYWDPARGACYRTWVINGVRQALHDQCQRAKRKRGPAHQQSLEEAEEADERGIEMADPAPALIEAMWQREVVAEVLARVSPRIRHGLELEFFQEMPGAHVAEILGMSRQGWSILKKRLFAAFRESLGYLSAAMNL